MLSRTALPSEVAAFIVIGLRGESESSANPNLKPICPTKPAPQYFDSHPKSGAGTHRGFRLDSKPAT